MYSIIVAHKSVSLDVRYEAKNEVIFYIRQKHDEEMAVTTAVGARWQNEITMRWEIQ